MFLPICPQFLANFRSQAFVGVNSEYLVDAIPELVEQGGIAEEFVGLILIPIVGNAAEHATAVTVAIKDKMDLAIGVAIGSSLQIVLLVLPLITIIGWGLHNDAMTLEFEYVALPVPLKILLMALQRLPYWTALRVDPPRQLPYPGWRVSLVRRHHAHDHVHSDSCRCVLLPTHQQRRQCQFLAGSDSL